MIVAPWYKHGEIEGALNLRHAVKTTSPMPSFLRPVGIEEPIIAEQMSRCGLYDDYIPDTYTCVSCLRGDR